MGRPESELAARGPDSHHAGLDRLHELPGDSPDDIRRQRGGYPGQPTWYAPAPGARSDDHRPHARLRPGGALELDVVDTSEALVLGIHQLVVEDAQAEVQRLCVHQPDPWVLANSSGMAATDTTISRTK